LHSGQGTGSSARYLTPFLGSSHWDTGADRRQDDPGDGEQLDFSHAQENDVRTTADYLAHRESKGGRVASRAHDMVNKMSWLWFILLGLVAGAISGLVGIGGGIIIVPALVLLFGFSQKLAQGTTLALLVPPIGIFAALTYYKDGYVNIRAAALIVVGFVVGSLFAARYVTRLSNVTVTRVFAVFLIAVAIRMLISAKP
jgi:uncharacterized membrane protein YqaE (UPF0057 family)